MTMSVGLNIGNQPGLMNFYGNDNLRQRMLGASGGG
jgi:hypothetical protein